jgi:lipopolysaccharide/colanic/teichoic acid biosynthesis glycosyltransferase
MLALYLRDARGDWDVIGPFWVISAVFTILGLLIFRVQDGIARYFSVHDAIDIAKAIFFAELMTCAVLFTLTRLEDIPRSTLFIHALLLGTGLIAGRVFVLIIDGDDHESREYGLTRERIVLIGANRFASFFIKLLNAYTPHQQRVVAVLDDRLGMVGRAISGVRVLGTTQQIEAVIDEFAIHGITTEKVVIAGETDVLTPAAEREVKRVCEVRGIELCYLPRMLGVTAWTKSQEAVPNRVSVGSRLPEAPAPALSSYFLIKRWIDVLASSLLIMLLLPILLAGALLVVIDLGLPVLFWQERLGRNGRSFLIYKFRTLRPPFDSNGKPLPESGRLSAIGRFLRATHIDELPQLLNVLIGDMSLIGPRPLLPEDQPDNITERLSVRPGMTGWAQVHGGKLVSKRAKQRLDAWYIRNASLWTDLRIAFMTLNILLKSHQPSEEALADAEQAQSRNVVSWQAFAARQEATSGRITLLEAAEVSQQRSIPSA